MESKRRLAVVVDEPASSQVDGPRQDYLAFAERLGAEVRRPSPQPARVQRQWRRLQRWLRLDMSLAWAVTHSSPAYAGFLATSEKTGLPLALLRPSAPLVVVGHKLNSRSKQLLWRLGVQRQIAHLITVSATQADYAVRHLRLPAERVSFLFNPVDEEFFAPLPDQTEEGFVLAVGREQRDYPTLLRAVAGTPLKVVIVASSLWSYSRMDIPDTAQVTVRSRLSYPELRRLYAAARLVVLPLFDVDYAAGVNGLQEAMAMARPLVVSRTRGLTGYVAEGETGVTTPPGNPEALRGAMLRLWDQPAERARLGANARRAVEDRFRFDGYIDRIVQIVQSQNRPARV